MQYADFAYYKNTFGGTILTEENANHYLMLASRHANNLCRGRIEGRDLENLSPFRISSIKEVVCQQAEFLFQNEDMLSMYLNQYAINGVSMQFGNSWNLHIEDGIAMPMQTYQTLMRTGLCYRGFHNYG